MLHLDDPVATEKALVGSLLLIAEPDRLREEVARLPPLKATDFQTATTRELWEATVACLERRALDCIVLIDELKRRGAMGGQHEIVTAKDVGDCMSLACVPSYAREYAHRVLEAAVVREARRRLGDVSEETDREILEEQVRIVMSEVLLRARLASLVPPTTMELVTLVAERYERRRKGELVGLPTGLGPLDAKTNGLANISVLAARPGMGKSSLARQIAYHIGQEYPVVYLSLEDDADRALERAAFQRAGECLSWAEQNPLHVSRMDAIFKPWVDGTLKVTFQRPRPHTLDCVAQAVRLAGLGGARLVIVDHLAHIVGRSAREGEYDFVSRAMGELEAAAADGGVNILVVHQLNRDCEKREDKRPMLSDLRASGKIEEVGALILFIYRDAYYDEAANEYEAEIIVAKNRNGPTGQVMLGWDGPATRFEDSPDKVYRGREPEVEPEPDRRLGKDW